MLSDEELSAIEKLLVDRLQDRQLWRADDGRLFDLHDVCNITTAKRGLSLYLTDGTVVLLDDVELGRFEKYLAREHRSFARTHNSTIANLDRVRSVSAAGSGSYLLHFRDSQNRVPPAPVSATYEIPVANQLDAGQTLEHLTPPAPRAEAIKALGLLDLGEDEAQQIVPGDAAAVQAWQDKWWIENFDRETMFRYFRQKTAHKLDKTRIIRNAIWQRYLSVKWGIWEPDYGDVRGFYYHPIEDILARNDLLSEGGHKADPDTVSNHLRDMAVKYRLFHYGDFKMPDPHPHLRKIGDRHPHFIVFAEKKDFIKILQQFAAPYGATHCAVMGEPSAHSMEIFAGLLKQAFDPASRIVHIFGITDINPGGTSIGQSIVDDLKAHGFSKIHYHQLATLDLYEPYQIEHFKKVLVKFRLVPGHPNPEPVGDAELSYITKARAWYDKVLDSDPRFIRERKLDAGITEVTLYGIQSNTIKPERLRRRFEEIIQAVLGPPPPASR